MKFLFCFLLMPLMKSFFHKNFARFHKPFFPNGRIPPLNNHADDVQEDGEDEVESQPSSQVQTIVRLPKNRGISKDQDGKSNVWSVEPRMQIVDSNGNQNLLVGGLIFTGIVASIPALMILSTFLPDPSNY